MVTPTWPQPNKNLVTLLLVWLEVTNMLTLMVSSKLSIMLPMLWDSEWLIPGYPCIILSSLLLPFMMLSSPRLPFTMVLLPNLSKTLLRWPPLRPNSLPLLKKLPAGKNVNLPRLDLRIQQPLGFELQ